MWAGFPVHYSGVAADSEWCFPEPHAEMPALRRDLPQSDKLDKRTLGVSDNLFDSGLCR